VKIRLRQLVVLMEFRAGKTQMEPILKGAEQALENARKALPNSPDIATMEALIKPVREYVERFSGTFPEPNDGGRVARTQTKVLPGGD